LTSRGTLLRITAIAVALCLVAGIAGAGEVRQYGDYFRDKYILHAREYDGLAKIVLMDRSREVGGPVVSKQTSGRIIEETEDGEEVDEVIRKWEERELASIRSEIILPAEPNYIKNPGWEYKIIIDGLTTDPSFKRVFHAPAGEVLDLIEYHFSELIDRASGFEREALYYGMLLAMRALNESQRLPARIPLTVLNSAVGRFRFQGPRLVSGEMPRLERFRDVREGGGYRQVFENPLIERFKLPDPEEERERREAMEARNTLDNGLKRFGQDPNLAPDRRDYRVELTRGLRDPRAERNRLGQPLEPLSERNSPLLPTGVVADLDQLRTRQPDIPPYGDPTLEDRVRF